MNDSHKSLESARKELVGKSGRQYWRSLENMAETDDFKSMVELEFPKHAAAWDPLNRRDFLRLMGASLALGGLTACTRQPTEKIVPFVDPPEDMIPGKPMHYATAMTLGGYGFGLLMESHMGRPTKAEGNPEHPASMGGTDIYAQASVLDLYDPDRSQTVKDRGRLATWDAFGRAIAAKLPTLAINSGSGLRILTETVTSPTLIAQMKELLDKYPKAKWVQYEPLNRDNVYAGAELAFGEAVDARYDLSKADIILSLDADFLGAGPGHVRYAHDYGARRKVAEGAKLNRLYALETGVSMTGSSADHRLAVSPDQVEAFARAVAENVGVSAAQGDTHGLDKWIAAVVNDLKSHKGSALVIAGDRQPAVVHALVHAINAALGAVGNTVTYSEPAVADTGSQIAALKELVGEMAAGSVSTLLVLGGNPVVNAPSDLNFADALKNVPMIVRLGAYEDETSFVSHWHLPEAHFLEAWSDVRCFDGSVSVVQPLIEPLYSGRSAHEVIAQVMEQNPSGYDIVAGTWSEKLGESGWRRALHDGFITGSEAPAKSVTVRNGFAAEPSAIAAGEGLKIVLAQDSNVYDGRFANNGWLQELPRPLSTLTWDNALLINSRTADEYGVKTSDLVVISRGDHALEIPVLVTVGVADGCGIVSLGYGRERAGRVGNGVGFNAYPLLTSDEPLVFSSTLFRSSKTYQLSVTQEHHTMQGRHHFRSASMDEFEHDQNFVSKHDHFKPKSIYPEFDYSKGPQWGMVIDLSACIGCNACMIACQAENNIPVVGKDQVERGREMYWIRVDRYYEGSEANAKMHHQPVTCMHCENAPCEAVCPVAATVHSTDGINQMVYNRCVGTRYCANNCPYKVRRFNFYKYADHETPSLKLQRNPDVTVRSRGVMEKCTYCTQRISAARIDARLKNAPIPDGGVLTACQQVCPTKAITFGDIRDPQSKVAGLKASPLNYGVLAELTTVPRTTYLARITNPNPELEPSAPAESHAHGA